MDLKSVLKIRSEISILFEGDRVILDGLGKPQLITGAGADTLLAPIVRRLDGTQTVEGIWNQIGRPPLNSFLSCVKILNEWGLLVENRTLDSVHSAASQFWTRMDLFLPRKSGNESVEALGSSRVVLYLPAELLESIGRLLASQLKLSGCTTVEFDILNPAPQELWGAGYAQMFSSENIAGSTLYFAFRGVPSTLMVGPLISGPLDGCIDCAYRSYVTCNLSIAPDDRVSALMASSLLASEILEALLKSPSALHPNRGKLYDLNSGLSSIHFFACSRLTRSRSNSHAKCAPDNYIDLGSVYNRRIPDEYPSFNTISEFTGRVKANLPPREYSVAKMIPLPREICDFSQDFWRSLSNSVESSPHPIDLIRLSEIITFAGGLRTSDLSRPNRWCASAGNLGSTRIHAITGGIDGLVGGIYTYDPYEHALADRCSRGSIDPQNLLTAITGDGQISDILVILTGRVDLLRPKYREFSYKLANLDAGVTFAQMKLVASATGYDLRQLTSWPDNLLEKHLNISCRDEIVTCVAILGRTQDSRAQANTPPRLWSNGGLHKLVAYDCISMGALERWITEEGKFHLSAATVSVGIPKVRPAVLKLDSLVPLPSRKQKTVASLGSVLAARRSVRDFSDGAVAFDSLRDILEVGFEADRKEWHWHVRRNMTLDFIVVLPNGSNHQRSIYRYHRNLSSLQQIGLSMQHSEVQSLFGQGELVEAPLTVIICANLPVATLTLGAATYRNLLFRAGASAHRMWLRGISLGLVGTLHAGLKSSEISLKLPLGGGVAPLLACSLGRPCAQDIGL